MKSTVFLVMVGISFPTLLTAQVKSVPKERSQSQNERVQTKKPNSRIEVLNIKEDTIKISGYKPPSVVSLKLMSKKLPGYDAKIVQVEKNKIAIPNPYNSENGVVLSALSPWEDFTGSFIQLNGAIITPELVNDILNGIIPRVEMKLTKADMYMISAQFRGLPPSNHLFLLTLSMGLNHGCEIRIRNSYNNIVTYRVDEFVYNSELQAYQVLLMLDSDPNNYITLSNDPMIEEFNSSVNTYFYYIQLVQLD